MSQRVSSAGMYLCYCAETTAGTMPTTGYTKVPEVKSFPSLNPSPNTIDSTTLDETEYETYVMGLKSLGGALEYGANYTDSLDTAWAACITAYKAAVAAGKAMWFCEVHPKLAKAVFYKGEPADCFFNEQAVGDMCNTTLFITATSAPIKDDKPTLAT